MSKKVVLTGGCGFVGTHFLEHFLKNTDWEIAIFDKLTYASSGLDRIRDINAFDDKRVFFYSVDFKENISDGIIKELNDVEYIFHLGAESHVNNSIENPYPFIMSNVLGTHNMLWFARKLDNLKGFLYFSTDECYGPAPQGIYFKEWDRHKSSNPYAATKAAAEELCISYENTYNLPIFITKTMNCFTGDTKIPLLDGTESKIKDLVNKEFYVYSYDIKNRKPTVGRAHNCKMTMKDAEIYEVLLDNGKKIKCTKDHLFLLRDGTYKEAQHLSKNDSLMPLYRKMNKDDREEVYNVEQKEWEKTHNLAYEYKYGIREKYMCAHHVDFNRHNNSPDNILSMEFKTHIQFHSTQARKLMKKLTKMGLHPWQNLSKTQLLKRAKTKKKLGQYDNLINKLMEWKRDPKNIEYWKQKIIEKKQENPEYYRKIALNNLEKANTTQIKFKIARIKKENGYYDKWKQKMKENNPMYKNENVKKMIETRTKNGTYSSWSIKLKNLAKNGQHPTQSKEVKEKISNSLKNSRKAKVSREVEGINRKNRFSIKYGFKNYDDSVKTLGNLHYNEKMTYQSIKDFYNISHGFLQKRIKDYRKIYLNNHKVVSVKKVGYDDVYDFTVDVHHNFALSAGVFVHNCYGERQHPEKFIPMCIKKILNDEIITIHADKTRTQSGTRHWIHARNVADAVLFLTDKFVSGDKYNIVGEEISNLEMAQIIANILNKELKYEMVDFHSSRPGHDLRYAMDGSKLKNMGWEPPKNVYESLEKTIKWTIDNKKWLEI